LIKVFAHNLFHKICEEERSGEKASFAALHPAWAATTLDRIVRIRDGTIPVLARSLALPQMGGSRHCCPNFELARFFL
jgi:hypothetical protein